MNREQLLDELTQDILAYVMHGSIPDHHVASELAPDELDERFDDFRMLVRVHFVLRDDVVDFVERLPGRLRSVKTQTENVSRTTRGTVDGRIDWSATVRERHSRNPDDTSLFVCESRSETYDIDENLVLKRLLALIHDTLAECEEYLERDYEWINDRWKGEEDLVQTMRDVFERNVHLTRIRSPEEYEPTDRMLQRARDSREPIYREAAELLGTYRETIAGKEEAVVDLLERTAITPDDDETLFELFVLFRYVSVIESLADGRFTLSTIETGSQEVARLTGDDQEVVLYHDNSARERGLQFVSDVKDKDEAELSRTEHVLYESREVANQYFVDEERRTWTTGRPDVIVLEVDTGDGLEYLVTEVKHSTRPETVERGIKETLEYLAFLRRDGELVNDENEVYGSGWNGVLVVQDIEAETAPVETQRSIRILQASELEDDLQTVVERVLQ